MTDAKKVIAICDDMPHALERTKDDLEAAGYTVLSFRAFPEEWDMLQDGSDLAPAHKPDWLTGYFTDFSQFIDAVRTHDVDMVVSDMQMAFEVVDGVSRDIAEKSGVELAVCMREAGLEMPIVISTAVSGGHVARTGISQELGRLAEKRGLDGEKMREEVPIVSKDAFLETVDDKIGLAKSPKAGAKDASIDDAQHLGLLAEAPCRALD